MMRDSRWHNMLVGVDFTPSADAALHQAVRLAQSCRARLRLVHVVDVVAASDLADAILPATEPDARLENMKAGATERLELLVQRQAPGIIRTAVEVRHGAPAAELLAAADEYEADLLVLGDRCDQTQARGTLGTTAARCVRKATPPVLLVRPSQTGPFQRVAVWIDFTDPSAPALAQALRIARQDNARLDLIHVFSSPPRLGQYHALPSKAAEDRERLLHDKLDVCLHQFLAPFANELADLDHEEHLIGTTRRPSKEVGEFARLHHDDLVVLGVRERSPLQVWFGASRAEWLARVAVDCSLLRVSPTEPRRVELIPEPVQVEPELRAA